MPLLILQLIVALLQVLPQLIEVFHQIFGQWTKLPVLERKAAKVRFCELVRDAHASGDTSKVVPTFVHELASLRSKTGVEDARSVRFPHFPR